MRKIVSLLFLVAVISTAAATSIAQDACQYIINNTAVYNLIDFAHIEPQVLSHTLGSFSYEFTFHLCNRAVHSCGVDKSKQNQDTLINAKLEHDQNQDSCVNVTGPKDHPVASFFNSTNSSQGMVLTFPSYQSKGKAYNFKVVLGCNTTIPVKNIEWTMDIQEEIDASATLITIAGFGAPGCPSFTLDGIIKFFEQNKKFFAVVFILIGLFALFAGLRFFNITIFILASFAASAALTVVIFLLTNVGSTESGRLVVFIICVLVGLAGGYIAVKVEKLGFFVLGAVLGGIGILFLYTAFFHFLGLSSTILAILIVLGGILGGWLALMLWKDIIILSTSAIGSYLVVRGVSLFVGGFPQEIEIAGGRAVFDYRAYGYLVAMVIAALLGMVYQFKNKKNMDENEAEYYQEPSIAKF